MFSSSFPSIDCSTSHFIDFAVVMEAYLHLQQLSKNATQL